ncbi:DUF2280 domain-containing protein [Acinetobacter sp. A47]|uniref:DUF2280 domain-containing protein n=1 Tax=Acinetobacter sp. A47 TaxID=1561217 RepID=UPI0005708853|nr:DUF2280 domain-containing protein [Acinetobacter sp. A47]
MAALKKEVKLYIVRSLAMHNTPQETVELVNAIFSQKITRQQCERYDPTKRAGQDLSQEFKDEFFATRKEFLEKPQNIPIANQTVRLSIYQKLLEKNLRNTVNSLKILEQIAKELGGAYTNRKEVTGANGGPVETVQTAVQAISTEEYLKARQEVLDEY